MIATCLGEKNICWCQPATKVLDLNVSSILLPYATTHYTLASLLFPYLACAYFFGFSRVGFSYN
jgi:hypothetical protein